MPQSHSEVSSNRDPSSEELMISGNDAGLKNPTSFQDHKSLLKWALTNESSIHPNVKLAFTLSKGFYLVVADDVRVEAGTSVASCSMSLTMSALNAFDLEPFSSRCTCFPSAFLESNMDNLDVIQNFYLMEQHILGSKSWWHYYIRTLPSLSAVQDLQFETPEDVIWIEGTNFKSGLVMQIGTWQKKYESAVEQLRKLQWPSATEHKYSWELYRWAATIFGSRSFTSSLLSDSSLAQDVRSSRQIASLDSETVQDWFIKRFAVLIPVLDLLNHQPMTKVEWQAQESHVGIKVLSDHTSGQEICNNYGLRDNEALLLAYGFVIENNPFDHVVVGIRVLPGSSLAKVQSLQGAHDPATSVLGYIFNTDHPNVTESKWLETSVFSFELFDCISVLCGNDRELQAINVNEQTLLSEVIDSDRQVEDSRNFIATISQIQHDCQARLDRLRAREPGRLNPPRVPRNQKQRNAQIYRRSQVAILETSIALCTLILIHTCTDWSVAEILNQCKTTFPPDVHASLEQMAMKHKFLTRPGELQTINQIISLLPAGMTARWRKLEDFLQKGLSRNNTDKDTVAPYQLKIMEFSTLLSFLSVQYETDEHLPPRLQSWIEQVVQWYPPDHEDWSSVPSEDDDAPPALLALLNIAKSNTKAQTSLTSRYFQPEKLCWAWNVVEQESVVVSSKVVELAFPEDDPHSHDVCLLMYCRNN